MIWGENTVNNTHTLKVTTPPCALPFGWWNSPRKKGAKRLNRTLYKKKKAEFLNSRTSRVHIHIQNTIGPPKALHILEVFFTGKIITCFLTGQKWGNLISTTTSLAWLGSSTLPTMKETSKLPGRKHIKNSVEKLRKTLGKLPWMKMMCVFFKGKLLYHP